MKIGQLVKILQTANPDDEVCLQLGEDDKYRDQCAKVEIAEGECLGFLSLDKVHIFQEPGGATYYDLILKQDNWPDDTFEETIKEFDEKHPEYKWD